MILVVALALGLLLRPELGVGDDILGESLLLGFHGTLAVLGDGEAGLHLTVAVALLTRHELWLASDHFHLLAT
jgi:hypothetical protein